MPELPEVETYVRELTLPLRGQVIRGATVRWARTIAAPPCAEFVQQIVGQRFAEFDRRGKYMIFRLENDLGAAQQSLIVHLRMTGKLTFHPQPVTPDRHTHLLLDFDAGGQLHFQDSRKFGRIWLVENVKSVLYKLGPEPLSAEFIVEDFGQRLHNRTAAIKALLLDQALVAGVGNIYADESLHLAGIHPSRAGSTLSAAEIAKLHSAVQTILTAAIAGHGSSLGKSNIQNYQRPGGEQGAFQESHRVFQRTGKPCITCGTAIERIVIAQRSTHFCPLCQPLLGNA